MTTAELYRKHKQGQIGRDKFIYEVRRDSNLPWITNITSYDDAVKILKNKGIISETLVKEMSYTNPDDEMFTLHLIDNIEGGNWDLTPEQLDAAVAYVEEHQYHLQGDFANNHTVDGGTNAAAKWVVNHIKSGDIKEEWDSPYDGGADDQAAMARDANRQPSKTKTISTAELLKIAKKAGKVLIDAESDLVHLAVAYGDRISMDAVNAVLANYDMNLEDLDDIEDNNDGEDKGYSIGDLYDRGYLQEQEKPSTDKILDGLNPYTVKAALNYELSKKPVNGDVEYGKLLDKIARKLKKNPNAYEFTQFANSKKIEKADAKLQMTPVKEKQLKDKDNDMKPIKGHKMEKANTKTSKKENKKGHPKGVKIMKENVIEELTNFLKKKVKLAEEFGRHDYAPGMEVSTPNGTGLVKEVGGGTVTVEYGDGHIRDFQMNYLNHIKEHGMGYDHYQKELENFDWEKKDKKQIEALKHTYDILSDEDKKKAFDLYKEKVDIKDEMKNVHFDGYNIQKIEESKPDAPHSIKFDQGIDQSELNFLKKAYANTPVEKIPEKYRKVMQDLQTRLKDRAAKLQSIKELLFKKKMQTGTATTPSASDNKPISLNPSDKSDQSVMKDPEFKRKYQPA